MGYTIDRWTKEQPGTMTLLEDGIQFASTENNILNFRQIFDNPSRLSGQTITYSALAEGNVSIVIGVNGGYPAADEPVGTGRRVYAITYTLPDPLYELQLYIQVKKNSTAKVCAAKLELGSTQTIARKKGDVWLFNGPPPNKVLELSKCQKYQYTPFTDFDGYGDLSTSWAWDEVSVLTTTYCTPLRKRPTLIVDDISKFRISAKTESGMRNDIVPTGMRVQNFIGDRIALWIDVDRSYGIIPGSVADLWVADAAGTVPLIFDANL